VGHYIEVRHKVILRPVLPTCLGDHPRNFAIDIRHLRHSTHAFCPSVDFFARNRGLRNMVYYDTRVRYFPDKPQSLLELMVINQKVKGKSPPLQHLHSICESGLIHESRSFALNNMTYTFEFRMPSIMR